jgi:hypothetical protein
LSPTEYSDFSKRITVVLRVIDSNVNRIRAIVIEGVADLPLSHVHPAVASHFVFLRKLNMEVTFAQKYAFHVDELQRIFNYQLRGSFPPRGSSSAPLLDGLSVISKVTIGGDACIGWESSSISRIWPIVGAS